MSKKSAHHAKTLAERLSYLLGEWKGSGKVITRTSTYEFQTHMVCLKATGSGGVDVLRFGDSGADTIFFGDHLHLYQDAVDGSLRARIELFDFSNFGDTVVESVSGVSLTEDGLVIESLPEKKGVITSRDVWTTTGTSGLNMKSKETEGEVSWSMEFYFGKRRV